MTKEQTDRLIRLPFAAPPDTTTAFQPPAPAPVVHQPAPDTSKALDDVAASLPVTKKGQIEFGF